MVRLKPSAVKVQGSCCARAARAPRSLRRRTNPQAVAVRGEVGEPDVARVISDWTGIPLTKLVEAEVDKASGERRAAAPALLPALVMSYRQTRVAQL